MIIYIDEYRKAKKRKATMNTAYDDELLCVNWNPAIAVTPVSTSRAAFPAGDEFIDTDGADLDTTEFMTHAYALATQI